MSGKRVMFAAMAIYVLAWVAACIAVQPQVEFLNQHTVFADCFEVGGTICMVEAACETQDHYAEQGIFVSGNYPGCDYPPTYPAGMDPWVDRW